MLTRTSGHPPTPNDIKNICRTKHASFHFKYDPLAIVPDVTDLAYAGLSFSVGDSANLLSDFRRTEVKPIVNHPSQSRLIVMMDYAGQAGQGGPRAYHQLLRDGKFLMVEIHLPIPELLSRLDKDVLINFLSVFTSEYR